MSYPFQDCCAPCPTTVQVTNVPGAAGATGAAGADGENGISSYTVTTANFIVPAVDANVTVSVGTSLWMVVDQNIFMAGPANFQVVSIPGPGSVVLKFLGYTGDVSPGATITAGTGVSVGGLEGITGPVDDPLLIANGGTGSTTKAGAQSALGLGQDSIVTSNSGLTQAITASVVEVGTVDVTIPAAGNYFLFAMARISFTGVTFAASRTVSLKVRNITQGVDIATASYKTGTATTQDFPNVDVVVPFIQYAGAVASDHLQLMISVDSINTAGTFSVVAGSLAVIPLRKT